VFIIGVPASVLSILLALLITNINIKKKPETEAQGAESGAAAPEQVDAPGDVRRYSMGESEKKRSSAPSSES
jgi:hypothetical protein